MIPFPELKSRVILAPLAGITDLPFRMLCRQYGAGMCFTEMISANAVARGNKATLNLFQLTEEDRPIGLQLFGQNTENIVLAAKMFMNDVDCIDFNLGCPAAKIIRQGAGSALLKRLSKIEEIMSSLTGVSSVPVTAKIRSGINKNKIIAVEIAKICEKAGASAVTVHARTQVQGYTGKADWDVIKDVVNNVSIPVIGNGDVVSPETCKKMLDETGCRYAMIGRAAAGNPFLFQQCNDYLSNGVYKKVTSEERIGAFFKYLELAEKYGCCEVNSLRQHAQLFTKGIIGASKARFKLNRAKTAEDIKECFRELA